MLNLNSQGGATGKNWNVTYDKIKGLLPKRHRIVFTKKAVVFRHLEIVREELFNHKDFFSNTQK
jgi:hypothetical protein